MKKIIVSICLALTALILASPVLAVTPDTAQLIVGRDGALDVGELTIEISSVNISVTYTIDEAATDWRLEETHLYIGDEMPDKHSPGKFPYKNEDLGGVASDNHSIALAEADVDGDGIVYVAAQAELIMQDGVDPETGEPIYIYESTWAQVGENDVNIGKGNNWATCFEVNLNQ
jgi:hypothetical protein